MHQSSVPKGLVVPKGIGAALVGSTWSEFEERVNVRWMHKTGKILAYTENATYIKLSLKPFVMNIYGNLTSEGNMKISLNNTSNTELSLKSGVITEVVLWLRPDFNVIAFDLWPTNMIPNAEYVGDAKTHSLSVAFSSIELMSIPLLK
jgi:hypothetical protein